MGWNDFVGKPFTREEFADYVNKLTWTPKVWNPDKPQKPKGIVLHNTAAPTLAQWAETGPKHEARIRNLRTFYEMTQKWHGGPHLFVSRDWINIFDGLLERGTHSPSFNASHFGIEMVGDYDSEAFDSGDGAKVRDNAVFATAVLCLKFGWDPEKVIKFHKEDKKTTHDCPGKNVVKADVVKRVKEQLAALGKVVPMPATAVAEPSPHVTDEMRRRMVHEIYKDEARRDDKGRLSIYKLPKGDGGGKYEVAGINERFHPVEAKQLADLIKAGRHSDAERGVQDFYMKYTNAVASWTNDAGLEYWLRSTAFNRGRKGAAMTLQMALGVDVDGAIGDQTKAAVRAAEAGNMLGLFTNMRVARERYERKEAHRDETNKFWKGLVNRWNKELADAHAFHAEQVATDPDTA
jgi:hypothetical protein